MIVINYRYILFINSKCNLITFNINSGGKNEKKKENNFIANNIYSVIGK